MARVLPVGRVNGPRGKRPEQKFGQFMVKYNVMDQIGQEPRNGQAVKPVFFT